MLILSLLFQAIMVMKHFVLDQIAIKELVEILLNAGFNVVVRPHPETTKRSPKVINSIQKRFGNHPNFVYEGSITSINSLFQSDIMISDWSGVALEYAFGLEKPVLFIDVPRKVNNPDFTKLDIDPIEDFIRHEIGLILPPEQIQDIPSIIKTLSLRFIFSSSGFLIFSNMLKYLSFLCICIIHFYIINAYLVLIL